MPRQSEPGALVEAERLVRSRFAASNRADPAGLRAAMHLPMVSLPGPRLSIRESESALLKSADFRALASVESWHSSQMDRFDIRQWSDDKAHCAVAFGRNASNGERYADGQSVYVVTCVDGRWAIQLQSVTLSPIGVGGADDERAVSAAADAFERWIAAQDDVDPKAVRRLVHLPFVDLDGARLTIHRSATGMRRDVAARATARSWQRSALHRVEVRERSAYKVTLETEIARFGSAGSMIACDRVLAILTAPMGRWALQVHSSFLTSSEESPAR